MDLGNLRLSMHARIIAIQSAAPFSASQTTRECDVIVGCATGSDSDRRNVGSNVTDRDRRARIHAPLSPPRDSPSRRRTATIGRTFEN